MRSTVRHLYHAVAVLGLSAMAATGLVGPAAAAVDEDAPKLVGLTLSQESVTVSGLDTVPVVISAHLTDDDGIDPKGDTGDFRSTPMVYLNRGTHTEWARLFLTSGTAQDGVWSTTVNVPSTWHGEWTVDHLVVTDIGGRSVWPNPARLGMPTTFRVTGTHQPKLTLALAPAIVVGSGKVTVSGRATFADTGKPIPGLPLYAGFMCEGLYGWDEPNVVTDAKGNFRRTFRADESTLDLCIALPRPVLNDEDTAASIYLSAYAVIRYTATIVPARTSVKAGRNISVVGYLTPAEGGKVELQRLVGKTWKTVSTGQASHRGRYSVTATPPKVGSFKYRVRIAGNGYGRVTGFSKVVTLRGTR
jgi:hypothetical protein